MNTKLLLRLVAMLFMGIGLGQSASSYGQGAAKALSFNGSSHVNMGDSLSRSLAQSDFTIEMWIKVRSNSSDLYFSVIKTGTMGPIPVWSGAAMQPIPYASTSAQRVVPART